MPVELDSKAFKVLSSETRVTLLKKVAEKPRSLTALASEIGMTVQSTDEHLRKLQEAGFVTKTRHAKWAYYEATASGKQVVQPKSVAVHLLLGVSFLMLLASAATLLLPQSTVTPFGFTGNPTEADSPEPVAEIQGLPIEPIGEN
ncbi:MAG TPA: winged helix-turn-helix domain-containing protein, partial [Candidatus Norongarragalinales archaeon]|nr:winged helix-turn-helix domain-containing protein [Candidatus Norongarragalinales archaeon]